MSWEESVILKWSIFKWKEYLTPNFGVNRFADDTDLIGLNHYYYYTGHTSDRLISDAQTAPFVHRETEKL